MTPYMVMSRVHPSGVKYCDAVFGAFAAAARSIVSCLDRQISSALIQVVGYYGGDGVPNDPGWIQVGEELI
jgi:hypothetical protein